MNSKDKVIGKCVAGNNGEIPGRVVSLLKECILWLSASVADHGVNLYYFSS